MTMTTLIGIDLAWKSERNPTGIALLEGDHENAQLTTDPAKHPATLQIFTFIQARPALR